MHGVLPMTAIVVTLLKAGWSEADVARELGMDNDEVLRFKQVSGLPELFREHVFPLLGVAGGAVGRTARPGSGRAGGQADVLVLDEVVQGGDPFSRPRPDWR